MPSAKRKLILKAFLSPGDICTLTSAIESLHSTYPGRYITDIRTSCDDLFLHNPRITKLTDAQAHQTIEMHYDIIHQADGVLNPFLRGYCHHLGVALGIPLDLTTNRPHLYISEEERTTHPLAKVCAGGPPKYWLLSAGIKRDFTLKQWPVEYYQEVVDHFRGKIQFVQVGASEHDHPPLDGVIDLIGQTTMRQLIQLAYHAEAGLGPITFLQHLCAAFQKPYVALLGGREPVHWTQYPLQTTLHTLGKLPCCRTNSCWRARVVRLNDESEHDNRICELPILGMRRPVGKCMAIIKPAEVIRAIEAFYDGGALSYTTGVEESRIAVVQAGTTSESDDHPQEIVAHSSWGFDLQIQPATTAREWMDTTEQQFAYECLPMVIANQSGWFVLATHNVVADWNGGDLPTDLKLEIEGGPTSAPAVSRVGCGILTWIIPYVFRTPPGWNLLCRGPANHIKDGVFPLEGMVETDWSFATFSMNWKLTRAGQCEFKAGEPIAMLVPCRRGDLESFRPKFADLTENPQLMEGYRAWIQSRQAFWEAQQHGDPDAVRQKYQKHYSRGITNQGILIADHQKYRRLKSFAPATTSRKADPTSSADRT